LEGTYELGYDGTTTAGYNITSGELGHLFYVALENQGQYNTSGIFLDPSNYGLRNTGDFVNLKNELYWYGTLHVISAPVNQLAWSFYFPYGVQDAIYLVTATQIHAIAVRPATVSFSTLDPEMLLQQALDAVSEGLDVIESTTDTIDPGETKSYVIDVPLSVSEMEVIVNWGGSELSVKLFDPDSTLSQEGTSGTPPIRLRQLYPVPGQWRCEVTATDIPGDEYPIAIVGATAHGKLVVIGTATYGGDE
jgi:hypothetical protein